MHTSILASMHKLFKYMLDEQDADFHTLFTTNKSFTDAQLTALYKIKAPTPNQPIKLPMTKRHGIFTHPTIVITISNTSTTTMIYHGKALLNHILCQNLPPRPTGVEPTPPTNVPEDTTTREKLKSIEDQAPCDNCHITMHPFSFAIKQYDNINQFRKLENKQLIDPSRQLTLPSSPDPIAFSNIRTLIDKLTNHTKIYNYLVKQNMHYTFRKNKSTADTDDFIRISSTFHKSRNIHKLFHKLIMTTAFQNQAKTKDNTCISP